jgi:hypothetical protein
LSGSASGGDLWIFLWTTAGKDLDKRPKVLYRTGDGSERWHAFEVSENLAKSARNRELLLWDSKKRWKHAQKSDSGLQGVIDQHSGVEYVGKTLVLQPN